MNIKHKAYSSSAQMYMPACLLGLLLLLLFYFCGELFIMGMLGVVAECM